MQASAMRMKPSASFAPMRAAQRLSVPMCSLRSGVVVRATGDLNVDLKGLPVDYNRVPEKTIPVIEITTKPTSYSSGGSGSGAGGSGAGGKGSGGSGSGSSGSSGSSSGGGGGGGGNAVLSFLKVAVGVTAILWALSLIAKKIQEGSAPSSANKAGATLDKGVANSKKAAHDAKEHVKAEAKKAEQAAADALHKAQAKAHESKDAVSHAAADATGHNKSVVDNIKDTVSGAKHHVQDAGESAGDKVKGALHKVGDKLGLQKKEEKKFPATPVIVGSTLGGAAAIAAAVAVALDQARRRGKTIGGPKLPKQPKESKAPKVPKVKDVKPVVPPKDVTPPTTGAKVTTTVTPVDAANKPTAPPVTTDSKVVPPAAAPKPGVASPAANK